MSPDSPERKLDLAQKEDLIIRKQIRQSTTKILQRPSHFHKDDHFKNNVLAELSQQQRSKMKVSPPVFEALVAQKKTGQLTSPALNKWLDKIENDFETFYREATEKRPSQDIAKSELDAAIPRHQLLDSGPAKDKVRLHRKSVSSAGDRQRKQQRRQNEIVCLSVDAKTECGSRLLASGSPKLSARISESNVARREKEQPGLRAGVEPDIVLGEEPTVNWSLIRAGLGRLYGSMSRRGRGKPDLCAAGRSVEEHVYEEIQEVAPAKRRKKKCAKSPEPPEESKGDPQSTASAREAKPSTVEAKTCADTDDCSRYSALSSSAYCTSGSGGSVEQEGPGRRRPFEAFQNCLFSTCTACVPWCLARRFYWKKDRRSEDIFVSHSRRNSRYRSSRSSTLLKSDTSQQ